MTRVYEGVELAHLFARGSGRVYEDLEFRRCFFRNTALSITKPPE
jgi:hypothetical protein